MVRVSKSGEHPGCTDLETLTTPGNTRDDPEEVWDSEDLGSITLPVSLVILGKSGTQRTWDLSPYQSAHGNPGNDPGHPGLGRLGIIPVGLGILEMTQAVWDSADLGTQ